MERRRPITEEDLLMTELLLARSYGNLKQSVVRASSRSLRSAGSSIQRHPLAIAGAAAGAGILLYGLFRLLSRNASGKQGIAAGHEDSARRRMGWEIASMLVPVITPYVTGYLKQYMGRKFSKSGE